MRTATVDLLFMSETYYPFDVFVLEVGEKEELSVDALLQTQKYMKAIENNAFYVNTAVRLEELNQKRFKIVDIDHIVNNVIMKNLEVLGNKYKDLVKLLETHLTNIQIYKINMEDLDSQGIFDIHIVTGLTSERNWMGVSTKLDRYHQQNCNSSKGLRLPYTPLVKKGDLEVDNFLKTSMQKFVFPEWGSLSQPFNEGCPFKGFVWKISEKRELMIQRLLDSIGLIKILSLDDFLQFSGYKNYKEEVDDITETEEHMFENTLKIFLSLSKNLKSIRVYTIGIVEIDIYIIGENEDGDWIGLFTKGVYT